MNMNVPHELLLTPERFSEKFLARESAQGIEFCFSPQLRAHFDKDQHAMWSRWNPSPRPCFNPSLLGEIRAYYDFLAHSDAKVQGGRKTIPSNTWCSLPALRGCSISAATSICSCA